MGKVKDDYDEYLDSLHEDDPGALFANYSGSRIMQEVDRVAYRCGLNDWSNDYPCQECGVEFCVDDPWNEDGVCPGCEENEEEEDE